tara:strand:+ start:41 stop:187 length:147 start_codon:yes stop_codon:yes gene_type:complete
MNKKYLKLAFMEANKDAKKYMNDYLKIAIELLGFFMFLVFVLFLWIIT